MLLKFNLSTIPDDEIVALFHALNILQPGNPILGYVLALLACEIVRRDDGKPATDTPVVLPLEQANQRHIQFALAFFLHAMDAIPNKECSLVRFLDVCYWQCEFASYHEGEAMN